MAERLRILALFGARVVFGQERANIEVLAALHDGGADVLCVIRPEEWPELMALRGALEARGLAWATVPYIDYPVRGWIIRVVTRNPGAYLKGNATLRRIARDFAATHIYAFNALYVASFRSALRSLDARMVYRAGDVPVRHNLVWRALWRFVVARTAAFVANSAYMKAQLIMSGVEPERVTVIYTPPPRRTDAPPVDIPQAASAPGAFRFVYVGQLIARKGVDLLVEGFKSIAAAHPTAHLLVAGRISDWSGDDWARDLRDRTKADTLIGERVHFLGLVEDAPELVRLCHVHLAPSVKEEPYGNVVVEAKSVARPSIVFRSGSMSELVEDGVDGAVVDDKSAAGLAEAMLVYAADPNLAAAHGLAASRSITKFGFESFARRWRAVFEGSAAVPRASARG
jgi:glycosyltransferase involved in cell wall biosynthesis